MSTIRSSSLHRYDVFLSFRGEDVRGNFLEYLYRALRRKGILTFKDDDKLRDGENIKDGLLGAIGESRFAIVVLSKNYANSSWCLKELVHILECKRTTGIVVYPVFYHVMPSEVRKQGVAFGKGFAKAFWNNYKESKKWREALVEVGNLKGWAYPSARFENEAYLIDEVVHKIFDESIDTYSIPAEDLVGIRSRMMQVIKLLDLGSDETQVVGLWGMGGIGKTTLAKAVYEAISWQFEGCSFIENVRELSNRNGMLALQEHLISDILMDKKFSISSSVSGMNVITNRVCRIKALIVLDDADESIELENLVLKLRQFSRGSRVIITTRNQHALTLCGAQNVFNVLELNEAEAIELFKSKAFAKDGETEEFRRPIDRAVQYAKGVPLALKVLGSFLLGGTVPEWESALDRLRESPDDELKQVLKISFDGLHWTEKEIFLDICCFFKGMSKDRATKILDGCGFNPVTGINVLVKKSLLTISVDDELGMHDLVQKMGWSIVDEESRKEPGKRSRLWRPEDVKDVIMENSGTKKVEGIEFYTENIEPRSDAFANMKNLRVLCIGGARCSIDLPNKLRMLLWDGCPWKCMPPTFQPKHLVELSLTNSHIEQLWNSKLELPKLTSLDLRHSTSLTKGPDFTGFPNLEQLVFKGCTALVDFHPSIKKLKKLSLLNLRGCCSLQSLPYGIESQSLDFLVFAGCSKLENILECFEHLERISELNLYGTGITELHHSIGNCADLCYLDLTDCTHLESIPKSIGQLRKLKKLKLVRCSSLSKLPEEVGLIDSLELLDVSFSGVRQLPESVSCLRNLQALGCEECEGTPPCFSGFVFLEMINLSFSRLNIFPSSISFCLSLKSLYLSGNDFECLPVSIKSLSNLERLWVDECKKLQELPELPSSIQYVFACGCESLKTICSPTVCKHARKLWFAGCPKLFGSEEIRILMEYEFLLNQIKDNQNEHQSFRLYSGPGSEIPKWISYQNIGGSLTFPLPIQDLNTCNLLGFAFSAVVTSNSKKCMIGMHMRTGRETYYLGDSDLSWDSTNVLLFFFPKEFFIVNEFHMGGTVLEVCFATAEYRGKVGFYMTDQVLLPAPEVKVCGVHLIFDENDESLPLVN